MSKALTGLIIMDGYGVSDQTTGNAVRTAKTPCMDELLEKYPSTTIQASGLAVGLPDGQMGNSEVGHLNIGAGRVVYQELTRITKSIQDGDFFENPALVDVMDKTKQSNKQLHLLGLCSDGGVHSHLEHLYALLKMAKDRGLDKVFIHCFMDGRDVPPKSGKGYIEQLQQKIEEIGVGKISTVCGRYYAMDRDNRWDRVEQAYNAIVNGRAEEFCSDPAEAMQDSYDAGVTDEFVKPTIVMNNGKWMSIVNEGDGIIFYNFRPDRARELTRALIMEDFDGFKRPRGLVKVNYVSMTQYDATFADQLEVAFQPETLTNTLGEYIAHKGKKQLRIAETEKYAHVTFFFNGGVEAPNDGEDRVLIPSPKVATYDLKPEMSAPEVTEEAVKRIESGEYDLMILNFANPDMVGHTGVMDAAVKAVETVDGCLKKVIDAILKTGGQCIVTADHGNSECMTNEGGQPMTAHTTNPVPLVLVDDKKTCQLRADGRLCDIAPTLLELMGMEVPADMTGKSLIK